MSSYLKRLPEKDTPPFPFRGYEWLLFCYNSLPLHTHVIHSNMAATCPEHCRHRSCNPRLAHQHCHRKRHPFLRSLRIGMAAFLLQLSSFAHITDIVVVILISTGTERDTPPLCFQRFGKAVVLLQYAFAHMWSTITWQQLPMLAQYWHRKGHPSS